MNTKTENYWVTGFNYLDEVTKELSIPEKVEIYDLSLREGNQTPGCIIRRDEMYDLALSLDDLGVSFIEFFPAVSPDDEWVATELAAGGILKNAKVSCLVRPHTKDMAYAARCRSNHIFLEGPAHMHSAVSRNYGGSFQDLVQGFVDVIHQAKDLGMTVTACPWDNGKATMEELEQFVRALAEAGADDICYGDTYGYTMPWTLQHMVKKYREWSGDKAIISCHFHNDFGMATACTLATVAAGARRVQVGMNYLGERAGNAPLDEVVMNLMLNMGVKTDIDLSKLYPLAKRFEAITKIPIALKKPFLGEEVNWSGSGIVLDMMMKKQNEGAKDLYIGTFNPQMVGRAEAYRAVWGKGCGAHMVEDRAKKLGLNPTREQVVAARDAVKQEAMLTKSLVPEAVVDGIIRRVCK